MKIEKLLKLNFAALIFVLVPSVSMSNKRIEIKPDDGVKLVECSLTSGDYQQIDVLTLNDGRLVLKMLDRSGGTRTYDLPRREWKSRAIRVPCWNSEVSACGDLVERSENQWSYQITGTTGVSIGDCTHPARR